MNALDHIRYVSREPQHPQEITDEISRRCEAGLITPDAAAHKIHDAEMRSARRVAALNRRTPTAATDASAGDEPALPPVDRLRWPE
jgi:hypothetical protein